MTNAIGSMDGSIPTRPKNSDDIRTEKIDFVVTQVCDIAHQSPSDSGRSGLARDRRLGCWCTAKDLGARFEASGSAQPLGARRFPVQTVL